VKLENITKTV